jgi:hypothetical protein
MKKIYLMLAISLFGLGVFADEPVLPNIFIWSDDDVNAATLKGYAEFRETDDTITLKDQHDFILNIKKPQNFNSKSLINEKVVPVTRKVTPSKYNTTEYYIGESEISSTAKIGRFAVGTTYNTNLDQAQIQQSTTAFTRYNYKNFAISTAYRKLSATSTGMMTDSMFIIPEYKLNSVLTLKEVLRSDIAADRTTNELVLSVNPFGKKDTDRFRFEFAAGQTFDHEGELTRTRLRFSTQLRL